MKTEISIKDELFAFIKDSPLSPEVKGKIYTTGTRPELERSEDIMISVLDINHTSEIQTAIVNVNIYVKGLKNGRGELIEPTARLRELAILSANILERHNGGDYRFTLQRQTILKVEATDEYAINNRIFYQHSHDRR